MTAEPRDDEEIRGLCDACEANMEAPMCEECYTRLGPVVAANAARDAALDRLAVADRDNAELRVEVERLRDLVGRQLGDCIGCSPETGPEETCPHDGRSYGEWVEIASMVIDRQHANEAERDDLATQLAAAQAQLAETPLLWSCPDCAFTAGAEHILIALTNALPAPQPEPEPKTAAQLLREIAKRDPDGHRAALGRAYGLGRDPAHYPDPEGAN